MSWRKCLVRGLVFSVLAGLAGAAALYQRLTSPAVVRQRVIGKLETYLRSTYVSLDSADLRLLGGISIGELRLTRYPDFGKIDLLYVPSGIIYHDKEQLLDGKLAIRKLELHRPRLHFIRGPDGQWNSAGILGPTNLNETIPTIVIQQGTIILEDRLGAPDAAPVELRDVNLTIVNDPRPKLVIQARGSSSLLGNFQARALVDRATMEMSIALDIPGLPVGPALVQRLTAYYPCFGDHAHHLTGLVQVHADLEYHPDAPTPWNHDLSCHLTQGRLQHPQLPLPLDQIEATLHCIDGQLRLDKFAACSGATRFEAHGAIGGWHAATDCEGDLKITHLPVNASLFERLPEALREIQRDYMPAGIADLNLQVSRRNGLWRRHAVVTTADGEVCYGKFPYRLEKIQGRIEEECDEANHVQRLILDLVAANEGARPVHVKGTIAGKGPDANVSVDIWGENVPLDAKLRAALPPQHQKVADTFQPTGKGDFVMQVRRQPGQAFANRILVRIHDATICYAVFPYPLENVSGVLDFLPDHWEFRDFKGSHKGGEFRTWGRSQPVPGDRDRIGVTIQGTNILLDDELEAALAPKLRAAWKSVAPGGRMNVEARVDRLPDRPEDIAVTVTTQGCTLRPHFFPYVLTDVSGTVRYAQGKVELEKIVGRHGGSTLSLDKGQIFLKPAGGFWAQLTNFQGAPLVMDADLLTALPPALKKVGGLIQPKTPVRLAAEIVIDMPSEANVPPDIFWDGGATFQDTTFHIGVPLERVGGQVWCQGRHDGRQLQGIKGNILLDQAVLYKQPFREMHTHFIVAPEAPGVLRLPDVQSKIFGGTVGGEARVEFGPTLHYELNLTALEIRLEEFGRHNIAAQGQNQWKGLANGRLYLRGHGTDIQGLEGNGHIDVPQGQMYNLPLFLDLIKVIGLRPPDRTAFEEAHATFSITGPRVAVSRLDLDGNAISLSGEGQLNLDGSDIQLDFYAVWGRIKQVLPALLRDIPPAVGKQLLKIKMRGSLNDVRITKEPVPTLVEPVAKLLQRLAGKDDAAPKKSGVPEAPVQPRSADGVR